MSELNVVVRNEYLIGDEEDLFFGPLKPGETVQYVDKSTDMYDLLVLLGLFSSKSQARKNWTKTGQEIPEGFSDLQGLGKLKHRLTTFHATPVNKLLEPPVGSLRTPTLHGCDTAKQ